MYNKENIMEYNRAQIKEVITSKGYKWFNDHNNKGYDVNIIGIRNSETDGKVTNHFDDTLTISYKDSDSNWKFHQWPATTDPGAYWMEHPMNTDGCAILVPGQYRGSHKIRLHQGKYEALGQRKPVKVYRDNDKDDVYDTDEDTITEGVYGINIHRSNPYTESTYVNKWSAGCQVFKKVDDFHEFMEICRTAKDIWGNTFSYTLIESKDFA
jgi:hypothetical protein|tara:strand:+ start:525 stop:1157 length:633 start_codon:yes stop_codon:yes gene_type:complete